jgi:hypothetical protein
MKIVIAGSRHIIDPSIVEKAIKESGFLGAISEIVSGGARGVDSLAEEYARDTGIPFKLFPADWDKYGKAAGPIRNQQMAEYADALIAVWDGKSKGTLNMINNMKKLNKPYKVFKYT